MRFRDTIKIVVLGYGEGVQKHTTTKTPQNDLI